jgi:hypothetical protein
MKLIHKCENFLAHYIDRSSEKVLITFDHFDEGKTNFARPSKNLYGFDKYSHLHVGSRVNDWYTSPGREELIASCLPVIDKYASTICFGTSMGGHAAILFGSIFKSSHVVAVSPRIQLDPDRLPFDSRNLSFIKKADYLRGDLMLQADSEINAVIVYDPFSKFDAAHVKMFKEHYPQWSYLALPFGGHPALAGAKSTKTIPLLAQKLAEGQASLSEIQKLYKSVRRQSPYYWHHHLSHPRHRPTAVKTAATVMEKHSDATKNMLFLLGDKLVKAGELESGLRLMRRAYYLTKTPPPWWQKRLTIREVQLIRHSEKSRMKEDRQPILDDERILESKASQPSMKQGIPFLSRLGGMFNRSKGMDI